MPPGGSARYDACMATVYGDRWRSISSLDEGGQSHVFVASDMRGEYTTPCVLKRIKNPKRRERFISEVQACKSLSHPGVIRVLDHSALDANGTDDSKMFLVMEMMEDGNLEKRVLGYRDALDSTLLVARTLAEALAHAHAKDIIHRDVKPANILFATAAHEPKLADFGICLIGEKARTTETGEPVGPWAFMAPELEAGGRLDVTAQADVYSLGKVIYFMLSGGRTVVRERHREAEYEIFSGRTVQHELLGRLLDRMICPLQSRVGMTEVIAKLDEIANWRSPPKLAISAQAAAKMARIRENATNAASVAAHNRATVETELALRAQYVERVKSWLAQQVKELIETLRQGGLDARPVSDARLTAARTEDRHPVAGPNLAWRVQRMLNLGTIEVEQGLDVVRGPTPVGLHHDHALIFRVHILRAEYPHNQLTATVDPRDEKVTFMPYYFGADTWRGYFHERATGAGSGPIGSLSPTLELSAALKYSTKVSAWPMDTAQYGPVIERALEMFLDRVELWGRPGSSFSLR